VSLKLNTHKRSFSDTVDSWFKTRQRDGYRRACRDNKRLSPVGPSGKLTGRPMAKG
jgi:hypothetical protein